MKMENYEERSQLYKILSEQYLFEQYAIKRLDERFAECETNFEPVDHSDAEQDGGIHLKYISLWNKARIERLEEAEMEVLHQISNGNQEQVNIAEFIDSTYDRVLAGDIRPGTEYEFFKDIYGKGILPGNAVVFSFQDRLAYASDGKIDWELEEQKSRIFNHVKLQFEKLANAGTKNPVYLVRMQI